MEMTASGKYVGHVRNGGKKLCGAYCQALRPCNIRIYLATHFALRQWNAAKQLHGT